MIDPKVAYEKLVGLTCKELAIFFESEQVLGVREGLYTCPIATWIRRTTGRTFAVSDIIYDNDPELDPALWEKYPLTPEMEEFITLFDAGEFVSLDAEYETVEEF